MGRSRRRSRSFSPSSRGKKDIGSSSSYHQHHHRRKNYDSTEEESIVSRKRRSKSPSRKSYKHTSRSKSKSRSPDLHKSRDKKSRTHRSDRRSRSESRSYSSERKVNRKKHYSDDSDDDDDYNHYNPQSTDDERKKPSTSSKYTSDNRHKSSTARSYSISSESEASSDNEKWITGKIQQLQEEKVKKADEKRKHKTLMKMMETPEEKRLRRLIKKEAKEKKRKERMGWDKDYMHYTNTDNPFGDANLLETFVWSKKMDKEGKGNVRPEEIEQQNKLKLEENRVELEKVKKRRLEREQERAQREEEMQRMQREKEAAQFKEWEKQEDTFHLQQALLRSKIRIDDGRAKPIDLLAKYISAEDEDLAIEMLEPYACLNGLSIHDLEDLLEDIKVYMELEKGKNLDYWNDITIIVEEELYKLRKADTANKERYGDRREGINSSVENAVLTTFKGKSHSQLLAMHDQIQKRIFNREEGTDIGYWESILARLKAQIAKARLRERHQDNLKRKLQQLKQEQGVESDPVFPIVEGQSNEPVRTSSSSSEAGSSRLTENKQSEEKLEVKPKLDADGNVIENSEEQDTNEEGEAVITETDLQVISIEEYNSGRYTPTLIPIEKVEPGTLITNPFDDIQRLEFARRQLIGTGSAVLPAMTAVEKVMEREAQKGMSEDEAVFSVEASIDHKVYLWSDKYRPRKPRYFNRVHTGFEWNKYNQTHYDMDNPPPKIVQGYKFNIFYPDLIDRSITPEYTLTPCPDNRDFGNLRFHAGPPYEDIAFKIVNREWEYSYKRGFRCQFHNNIFQLWFHFKRYRYRR
ncbi:hypothetical protein CHUAL_002680 [Chamberlinius hualienensis]